MKKPHTIIDKTDTITSFVVGVLLTIVIGILTYSILVNRQEKPISNKVTTGNNTQGNLPTQHTVISGESLWSIAEMYYKSGYNWVDIANVNNLNNPDRISIGQTLIIPDVKPILIEDGQISATSTVTPIHSEVTVVEGDTLWDIAEREYQSGYRWVEIAKLNSIQNPDWIYPGTVLRLR